MSGPVVVDVAGCDPVRLTGAMRRGLLLVAQGRGTTRRSNITDERTRTVYWQSIDRLHSAGLVEQTNVINDVFDLTALGRRVAYEIGWAG